MHSYKSYNKLDNIHFDNLDKKYSTHNIQTTYKKVVALKNSNKPIQIVDGCYEDLIKIVGKNYKDYPISKREKSENDLAYYAAAIATSQDIYIWSDVSWIMNRAMENAENPENLAKYGMGILPSRILWLLDNGYTVEAIRAEEGAKEITAFGNKKFPATEGETYFRAKAPKSAKSNIVLNCAYLRPNAKQAQKIVERLQTELAEVVLGKRYEYKPSATHFAHRTGVSSRKPHLETPQKKSFSHTAIKATLADKIIAKPNSSLIDTRAKNHTDELLQSREKANTVRNYSKTPIRPSALLSTSNQTKPTNPVLAAFQISDGLSFLSIKEKLEKKSTETPPSSSFTPTM